MVSDGEDGTSCITTLVVNLSSRVSIVDGIPVVVEVTANLSDDVCILAKRFRLAQILTKT